MGVRAHAGLRTGGGGGSLNSDLLQQRTIATCPGL